MKSEEPAKTTAVEGETYETHRFRFSDINPDHLRHVDWVINASFYVGVAAAVLVFLAAAMTFVQAIFYDDTKCWGMFVAAIGAVATVSVFFLKVAVDTNLRAEEVADNVVAVLRDCWDELRRDKDLQVVLAKTGRLTSVERLQVRSFLARVADAYSMVVYYTEHGYWGKDWVIYEVAYRNTFKSLLANPHVLRHMDEIWNGNRDWQGEQPMMGEYEVAACRAITRILSEATQREAGASKA